MYAVIETGGKQYRVEPGQVIDVELLPTSEGKSNKIKFERVLMVGGDDGIKVGSPEVKGAQVTAEIVDAVRADKIRVFKMKRRKGYRRTQGHRQDLMRVRIEKIKA